MMRLLFVLAITSLVGCDIFPEPPCPLVDIACPQGSALVADENGCFTQCEVNACFDDSDCFDGDICVFDQNPAFLVALAGQCIPSQCNDESADRAPIAPCENGERRIDSDGDGCPDICPETQSCFDDRECNPNQYCDTVNYCDAPPECGEGLDCPAVCYGRCVEEDACPALPPAECEPGSEWGDTDGDGCDDSCVNQCDTLIDCAPGSRPVDIDGDGCADLCEAGECEDLPEPQCEGDETPYDSDGDGCYDTCGLIACPAIAIECAVGFRPADTSGDGCLDSCVAAECNEIGFVCEGGDEPVDTTGDGCVDSCPDVYEVCQDNAECGDGQVCDTENYCEVPPFCEPGQGCPDVCYGRCVEELLCPEILCDEGTRPVDSNDDGCLDTCERIEDCEAYPSCDEGHIEIESTDECLQDVSCYSRSICGYTILCTG